jgi:hypothetical protein
MAETATVSATKLGSMPFPGWFFSERRLKLRLHEISPQGTSWANFFIAGKARPAKTIGGFTQAGGISRT